MGISKEPTGKRVTGTMKNDNKPNPKTKATQSCIECHVCEARVWLGGWGDGTTVASHGLYGIPLEHTRRTHYLSLFLCLYISFSIYLSAPFTCCRLEHSAGQGVLRGLLRRGRQAQQPVTGRGGGEGGAAGCTRRNHTNTNNTNNTNNT